MSGFLPFFNGEGGPPIGAAGGDLSGSYPNPTVVSSAGSFTVHGIVFNDGYGTATTTDNGTYTIYTATAIANGSLVDYVITVVGWDTTHGDCYRADFAATYKSNGAALTAVGAAPVPLNVRNTAGAATWSAAVSTSGASVIVQVTGATAVTVNWKLAITSVLVS